MTLLTFAFEAIEVIQGPNYKHAPVIGTTISYNNSSGAWPVFLYMDMHVISRKLSHRQTDNIIQKQHIVNKVSNSL